MTNHIRPFHTDRYLINLSKHIPQQRMKLFLALLFIIIIILIYYCYSLRVCLHWGVRESKNWEQLEINLLYMRMCVWMSRNNPSVSAHIAEKNPQNSNSNFLHVFYVWNHGHVTTVHRHTVMWPSCFEPHFWAVFRNVRPSEVLLSVETSVSTILFSVNQKTEKKLRLPKTPVYLCRSLTGFILMQGACCCDGH